MRAIICSRCSRRHICELILHRADPRAALAPSISRCRRGTAPRSRARHRRERPNLPPIAVIPTAPKLGCIREPLKKIPQTTNSLSPRRRPGSMLPRHKRVMSHVALPLLELSERRTNGSRPSPGRRCARYLFCRTSLGGSGPPGAMSATRMHRFRSSARSAHEAAV